MLSLWVLGTREVTVDVVPEYVETGIIGYAVAVAGVFLHVIFLVFAIRMYFSRPLNNYPREKWGRIGTEASERLLEDNMTKL